MIVWLWPKSNALFAIQQLYHCPRKIFMLEYAYNGNKPGVNEQIAKMMANASDIRDITRVLGISIDKVMSTLKKQKKS